MVSLIVLSAKDCFPHHWRNLLYYVSKCTLELTKQISVGKYKSKFHICEKCCNMLLEEDCELYRLYGDRGSCVLTKELEKLKKE